MKAPWRGAGNAEEESWPFDAVAAGRKQDEAENTPTEERTPCPNCGSITRRYETTFEGEITAQGSLIVHPPTIQAHATVHAPTVVQIGMAVEHDEALPIDHAAL